MINYSDFTAKVAELTLKLTSYVTRLSPRITKEGKDAVELSCVGKSPESLVRTHAALSRDPHFSEPTPQSETDPEKGAPEGFLFRFSATYYPEGRP